MDRRNESRATAGRVAITREPSPTIGRCELTWLPRRTIDVDLAREQHRRYEGCLEGLGCRIRRLPAAPELPDAVFVEDTAVVLDELAVIARPGAESRRPETASVEEVLRECRELARIEAPATLDGGDVLRLGRRVWVGLGGRTNGAAMEQMRRRLEPLGYRVDAVDFDGCLHLKSAVCRVREDGVLLNPAWVDPAAFDGVGRTEVDPREPYAANVLAISETLVFPAAHPRTRQRLVDRGANVVTVDVSELAKAEGGVTCCSLIVESR